MTVAEFLAWGGDGWQLVDGEPQAMAPASRTHGALQAELGRLLGNHLVGGPCSVVVAPGVVPRILSRHNLRIPDLAVACGGYSAAEEPTLEGVVLVVEILSPSNRAETLGAVWSYASIPSVTEILVLHSTVVRAELLRRGADGSWPEQPVMVEGDGVLELASVGFEAGLAGVYRTTRLADG